MRIRLGFIIALLMLSLSSLPLAAQQPAFRVIGYFTSWGIFDREYLVTDIPADKLTHINYAFANISEDGEIVLGDEWADTQIPYPDDDEESDELKGNFRQLQLLKEAHPHLQTLISVGGWSWSGRFSDAALTPESRATFARSAVAFILDYGFDGVDIDWEYPTGSGLEGNVERPEDAENYILLLAELRAQLDMQTETDGKSYLLTITVGAGEREYQGLDWARIHPLVDFISVMTFDMGGPWSEVTAFNAPLYDTMAEPPEGTSTDRSLQGVLAEGVPADKLIMGIPFYGRGWSGVPAENNGLHQPFTGLPPGTWDAGSFDYRDLVVNYVGTFERFWDDTAQVPWLYDADSGVMISYDDAESIAGKAAYVREHGLGGIMVWELGTDDDAATLLTAVAAGLNPD